MPHQFPCRKDLRRSDATSIPVQEGFHRKRQKWKFSLRLNFHFLCCNSFCHNLSTGSYTTLPRARTPVSYTHLDVYKRQAEHNSGIFDRVMTIHDQIALRLDRQIEKTVSGKALEHVIEKADPGIDLAYSAPVQFQTCLLYTSRCV